MPEIQVVYCPACERHVRIALTDPPIHSDGHATIPDVRRVCLDFGEACERPHGDSTGPETEARCPVFRVGAAVMGIERARSGLGPEPRARLTAPCRGCGMETKQEWAARSYAICEICGSTNPVEQGER